MARNEERRIAAARLTPRRDAYAVLADYYDAEHDALVSDVEFYRDLAGVAGPDVLDLACGTGRVGLGLAASGLRVIGGDASEAMLTIAEGKRRQSRVAMELRRFDMRSLDFTSQFNLVVCALDSFGHMLTIEDQESCLAGVFRALKPGGVVAIDVMNPSPEMLSARDGVVLHQSDFEADGIQIRHFVSWLVDYEAQQMTVEHMYDSVGADNSVKRRQTGYDLRFFFRFEMELLLRAAGLTVRSVYSDYDRSEYKIDGHRMLFIASRE